MFESLEGAPQLKISGWITRAFFGIWALVGVELTFLDLRRHGLHTPILLCVALLMLVLSAVWLHDSWMGSSSKKFNWRLITIMMLSLILSAVRGV
jgi:hypothetical protein